MGDWKVTLGIEKSKVLEHKGKFAQISCLLDAATANGLRAHTIPAIPATVPIFGQEDETVASSNMSSRNGLLPPVKSPASALKKPPASAAKKPPVTAAKKPSVPAASKDPFEFELNEAEPRSNHGSASKPKKSCGKPSEAAAKTATPVAGKATAKPPTKASGKGSSAPKENVFDFPADDGGGKAESEARRPAHKQPAQPPASAAKKPPVSAAKKPSVPEGWRKKRWRDPNPHPHTLALTLALTLAPTLNLTLSRQRS